MGSSAGRAKRDREKARQEKQAIKRERRQGGAVDLVDDPADEPGSVIIKRPQDDVLADLARLHQRFDDEAMDFDDFETAKRELIAQLDI
jgi:hypothetical protein